MASKDAASANLADNQTTQAASVGNEDSLQILAIDSTADELIQTVVSLWRFQETKDAVNTKEQDTTRVFTVGLAALQSFLQINVTGPVVSPKQISEVEGRFLTAWKASIPEAVAATPDRQQLVLMRRECLKYLQVDGVSPYAHIPYLELFCLAKYIFTVVLFATSSDTINISTEKEGKQTAYSLAWTKLRVHVWHYKLVAQLSFGGSNFTKSAQWSDLPTLTTLILDLMQTVRGRILGNELWAAEQDNAWSADDKVQFILECVNNYILLGRADKAKELVAEAAQISGFVYALSGALGKRTRFQEKSTSQLVVLARSNIEREETNEIENDPDNKNSKPEALQLNNDTLLEEIHFTKEKDEQSKPSTQLPTPLVDLEPDNQPQLDPVDQIILLAEATLKDAFSPVDTLTSEEIMPFATRVITDKSTNWQIYTQALLVRSRIEMHRSRTMERGILQLQALADQVLSDTTYSSQDKETHVVAESEQNNSSSDDVPSIEITSPAQDKQTTSAVQPPVPSTFLPAPTASESAPADVRLRYVNALSTPPRWHLEAELAAAWANVGSLVSALEIFKRLRLWSEVAICLASAAAFGETDDSGRGSGSEDKARAILRWRLFHRTGETDESGKTLEDEEEHIGEEVTYLKPADFTGSERNPQPSDAPRLWCLLGDLDNEPNYYERAWEISNGRFSRAQRSLGEYYIRQNKWEDAHAAYKRATAVNRLNPEMWGRLGDISLRLSRYEDAAEAYSRSIGSATGEAGGEDAKTWSNLGSALWSLCREVMASGEIVTSSEPSQDDDNIVGDEEDLTGFQAKSISRDPVKLVAQALTAFKKGASIAHDNWRIWENVVTLAARTQPPAIADMIMAMKQILNIRKTEDAVNADVLNILLQREVLPKVRDSNTDVYEPPRGSIERLISRLIEEEVAPLITKRSELWAIVSRLRAWHRDYFGAIDASERAWRAAYGSSSSGLLAGDATEKNWTEDEEAWTEVVKRTDELVSVLENWGPDVEQIGARWRGKARNAVRSVMGRGKENWEDSQGWKTLEQLMENLKI